MSNIDTAIAFSMGLLGSLHCIGMCGGLVAALFLSGRRDRILGPLVYHGGRIAVYVLLGLAAGLMGKTFAGHAPFLPGQQALSITAGLFIILFALQTGGFIPEGFLGKLAPKLPASLLKKAAGGGLMPLSLAGMANGLLPCAMVYAALALALKQADPLRSALVMAAFGLGTLPAFFFFSLLMARFGPKLRARFLKTAALAMVLFGLFTVYRGVLPPLTSSGGAHHHGHTDHMGH